MTAASRNPSPLLSRWRRFTPRTLRTRSAARIAHGSLVAGLHSPLVLTIDGLLRLWNEREKAAGPRKARDRETLQMFEGELAVPLPEMDSLTRSAVANLLHQGGTAVAQRIASVEPAIKFPSGPSAASQKRARNKTRALKGMWDENRLRLQRRQRARWLVYYASAPVVVRPAYKNGQWSIVWEPRSALSAYPAPTPTHLDMTPRDTVFASTLAASQVEAAWPDRAGAVRSMRRYDPQRPTDTMVTLIEYCGPDEYICAVVGGRDLNDGYATPAYDPNITAVAGTRYCVELERVENRIGRSYAIVPNSISLEQPLGNYEGMKGMYQMQAALMAKEYRYVSNTVDPAIWFVENDTGGEIVTVADGPAGVVGHVRGGQLTPMNPPPGVATNMMIDRLERAQRLEGGVPADLGGESASNIRTGRRGQDILAAVLDFPIQEAQEVLAQSQWLEDRLAMDLAVETFPNLSRTWGGFEFTPSKTFERGEWHEVSYALAGTDADGQVIRIGQLVGTGLMSEDTGRELIPDIANPELEKDRVVASQIRKGILQEFMQPSQPGVPGGFDLVAKARVAQLVEDDKLELAEAILRVQREVQEQQSPELNPVSPGAPEAMPGIGGASQQAGVAGAAPSLDGLSQLLAGLRSPQQFSTPQEAAAGAQAVAG